MHQTDQDLFYMRSTVHELEDYLLSNVLFWPISGKTGQPLRGGTTQLTIGNLLLSLKRLESIVPLNNETVEEIVSLSHEVNQIRRRWKSNWDKKIGEEIRSRLRQFDHYLSEISQNGEGRHGDYPYNIRLRVILGLLFAEIDRPAPREEAYLGALDARLKNVTHPVDFIWDQDLQKAFPEKAYWFLYRSPA